MTGLRRRIGWGDERGQVLILTGAVLIVVLFLGTVVVDVGNWFVHRRHLQTQVDAAALAAATAFNGCFLTPTSREHEGREHRAPLCRRPEPAADRRAAPPAQHPGHTRQHRPRRPQRRRLLADRHDRRVDGSEPERLGDVGRPEAMHRQVHRREGHGRRRSRAPEADSVPARHQGERPGRDPQGQGLHRAPALGGAVGRSARSSSRSSSTRRRETWSASSCSTKGALRAPQRNIAADWAADVERDRQRRPEDGRRDPDEPERDRAESRGTTLCRDVRPDRCAVLRRQHDLGRARARPRASRTRRRHRPRTRS